MTDLSPVSQAQILATFTLARRKQIGLTRGALAKRFGLKAADIKAVEKQRLISIKTQSAMLRFNELEGK